MPAIGDRLDGKYRILSWLGGGGFGEVFLADDEVIPGRYVAIKILAHPRDADHSDLLREMQTLAQIDHPHIVRFYHHFADEGRLYLVMEFCPAGSLDHRLRETGPGSIEQVFVWGLHLSEALAFVHGMEVVHHDVKPQNIFFAQDGTIKLGDFGVANLNTGTRLYQPPEMLLGAGASRTDSRVDVYALGLTLLEALTGRHPFETLDRDEAIQARIAHDFIPSDLPRWVQEILLKATHPTPELRFQTAADFGDAIRGRHVPYVFDGNRIKADMFASRAEVALTRRRWRTAERYASFALKLSPDCVAALLAAGRCQLMIRHIDRASEYFSRALSISPRTQVQKELGWIHLEQGRLPMAISLLTDHLQRNASDYEAYNLLLKCFYLSDRFEAGVSLARMLIEAKAPTDCFRSNLLLCRCLEGSCVPESIVPPSPARTDDPFILYNSAVVAEVPRAWAPGGKPSLKTKLLFKEYRFGAGPRAGRRNTLAIEAPNGARHALDRLVVSIGSLPANDIVLEATSVSRRHCAIVNFRGDVWLHDLESTVGTTVDGQPLGGRMYLDGVHEVTVGRVPIRVAASSDLLL